MSVGATSGDDPSKFIDDPENRDAIQKQRDTFATKLGKLVENLEFIGEHDPKFLNDLAEKISPLASSATTATSDLESGLDSGLGLEDEFETPPTLDPIVRVVSCFNAIVHKRDPTEKQQRQGIEGVITEIETNDALFKEIDGAAKQVATEKFGRGTERVQHSLKNLSIQSSSELVDALDLPQAPVVSSSTFQAIKEMNSIGTNQLTNDMEPFAIAFGSSYTYSVEDGELLAEKINLEDKHPSKVSDANIFIIMGSNDLKQVEAAAREIRNHPNYENMHVYISGFGGHGTIGGPIFSHTEAETMGKWLADLGINPDRIHLEPEATNSGENVKFLDKMIMKDFPNETDFIMSGTHAAVYRQVLTLAGQTTNANMKSISVLPTSNWRSDYFSTDDDAKIYTCSYLREMASTVIYSLTTRFLAASDVVEKESFQDAMFCFFDYYERLAKPSSTLSSQQKEELVKSYLDFCSEKVDLAKDRGTIQLSQDDIDTLKAKYADLISTIKPMSDFFRGLFGDLETLMMPRLNPNLTLHEQTLAIAEYRASPAVQAIINT